MATKTTAKKKPTTRKPASKKPVKPAVKKPVVKKPVEKKKKAPAVKKQDAKKPAVNRTTPSANKKAVVKKAVTLKTIKPAAKKSVSPATSTRVTGTKASSKPAAVEATKAQKPTVTQAVAKAAKPVTDISYNPKAFEKKWQEKWEADGLYRSVIDESKPKHYALTMLPYTSGDLHFGHWYPMAPSDARARFKRMNGYNVLFPIGFDAFGLPAENAAIKRSIHPKKWTFKNIENMRRQLKTMGAMFDWEREAITAEPRYYKWTEWFFIQLYKAGLAYRKKGPVDFCPNCNTTLAREQVIGEDRLCERCETPVIKKDLEQWFFKQTKYADELLVYQGIDWPERVKVLQTNFIDRSEGASVVFKTEAGDPIEVFTTRPDTLWGATFMVLAPEHPLVNKVTTPAQKSEVEAYKFETSRQSDIDRETADKEKTGVWTGGHAINPVNNSRIPIWIADYVLMSYGTGAIMAVPAHDERDFAFARKYHLLIMPVIQPDEHPKLDGATMEAAYVGGGHMVNSGQFNGTTVNEEKGRKNPGIAAVIDWLEKQGIGKETVNYRYRDWLISRQRYWGAPIPMIHCEKHGWNSVPDKDLPVLLPDDVEWKPTGESPLKLHPTWKHTTCPICGGPAERETDTMDTFMCSSWYHLRYLSPNYEQGPFDDKEYNYWMPVDTYTGGIEHATMHLLYTRFFHKALRDMGITEGGEPMLQLRNQGMILGEDGRKMSKKFGNVVAPDELTGKYGTDALRTYLMFSFRWEEGGPWNSNGIEGNVRWLKRVWLLFTDPTQPGTASDETRRILRRKVHQTLKRVTRDFEQFQFNTIISSLMELLNDLYKAREAGVAGTSEWNEALEIYLKMLAPVAPHISEELWMRLGKPYSIHTQKWPAVDEAAAREEEITLVVQVNGKLRDRVIVPADVTDEAAKAAALASEAVKKHVEGKSPKQVVYVKGRLVNIVV